MRILEFDVSKQRLQRHRSCDFTGLVAGSVGYLHAKFYFSSEEWDKCTVKIASFWKDNEEFAVKLDENNSCCIDSRALTNDRFEVKVIGASNDYRLETNKIRVRQEVS